MRRSKALTVLIFLLIFLGTLIFSLCKWAKTTFNVGIQEIIYTMTGSLAGTEIGNVISGIKFCLPPLIVVTILFIAIIKIENKKQFTKHFQRGMFIVVVAYFFGSLLYVERSYDIVNYIKSNNDNTTIYEDYYIDPRKVEISSGEKKRNLIYVFLESTETTYANEFRNEENYIPNLTRLARENISFSNTDMLGGMQVMNGMGWTLSSTFAAHSGLPFRFPIVATNMDQLDTFATGVYMLGDLLHDQGYIQEYMYGSDVSFSGTDNMFRQHGDYELFDYDTAKERGYISKDYSEWWGFEDAKLYEYAKIEILELAKQGKPFNFTMSTMDQHHIGGYVCQLCGNEYEEQTANVIACSDNQLNDFVEWCKQQDFYDNTTIVVTGDHRRMDNFLVEGVSDEQRTIYNCIINSAVNTEENNKYNRLFSQMDMFPTIVAALGFNIEGDKLGLGTNLLSGEKTLIEELGFEYVNKEFEKSSDYYVDTFGPELRTYVEGISLKLEYDVEKLMVHVYLEADNDYDEIFYSIQSDTDGDYDVKWYSSKDKDRKWKVDIDLYDYENAGDYVIQAHLSKDMSKCIGQLHQRFYKLPTERICVDIEDIIAKVVYKTKEDKGNLRFFVWCDSEGQNDMKVHEVHYNDGMYQCDINLMEHGEKGIYKVHVYDEEGILINNLEFEYNE